MPSLILNVLKILKPPKGSCTPQEAKNHFLLATPVHESLQKVEAGMFVPLKFRRYSNIFEDIGREF
jgi:hypothetical protein